MGELFRSEEMKLIQLFFQMEAAHDAFDELGHLGLIQFKDLNPDVNLFQRNFVTEVKRADEMERRLRFLEEQLAKAAGETLPEVWKMDYAEVTHEPSSSAQMEELESQLEDLEKELSQLNSNQEALKRSFIELIELRHVLSRAEDFFEQDMQEDEEAKALWDEGGEGGGQKIAKLGFVTGVVSKSKMQSFERVLWRATRGNLFMKHDLILDLIEDPNTGEREEKNVFIIFFQGARAQDKIRKICESFAATLYACPDSAGERRELLKQVETRLEDLDVVLGRSNEHRERVLQMIAPNINQWKAKVMKEKSIYHTMNMCNYDTGRKCLIAEGWCPSFAIDDVQAALKHANERSGAVVPSILHVIKAREDPPTYYKTNKFTSSFQGIVDAYGMARYQEVNPGPYTIVTFPFLFGVMFGDIGHGFLMFLFALFLVLKEKSLSKVKLNEMIETCFHGRYLLLLMAICSIYCGFIYNEFFSIPLDLFGTRWEFKDGSLEGSWTGASTAYPFGVDPTWKGARNELTYYNSLKMKLSVIFGVTQMCFGIVLSLVNAIHFRKPYNIWFEFIPQMAFMLSIFGYLCFLIFLKWCIDFVHEDKVAPYLLNLMIDMFLKPFSLPDENNLFPGQLYVQWVLIVVAAISVPTMLLVKPLLLRRDHKKKMHAYHAIPQHPASEEEGAEEEEEEEFDFGEIFIHQIIHTIEFVLGAISNTASYLRLWALSLAHSELATVFWDRVLLLGFEYSTKYSLITAFVAFAVWAGATFGVLLVMESLSAFLHALRLHWVEFQNKFYTGDGYRFVPFSYRRMLSGEDE